jgi:hypothetical protein
MVHKYYYVPDRVGTRLQHTHKSMFGANEKGDGGPLRPVIKVARESINSAAEQVCEARESAREKIEHVVGTGKAHMGMTLGRVGIDTSDVNSFNDFRRMHPQVLIYGSMMLVALPSAFMGKMAFSRNMLMTAGLSSAVAYGPDWWSRRHPPHSK